MSGRIGALPAPYSPARIEGSRALVECTVTTRAVGRTASDSEAFWFTDWDWDTQVIWATVRGFFDAYNLGRFDQSLGYISETGAAGQTDEEIEVLKRAKLRHGRVSVEAITDLAIAGSTASGTVNQIIRGCVTRQRMSFVKEKGSWKISRPISWNDIGLREER